MRVGAPDGFGSYFLAPRLGASRPTCTPNSKSRSVATARLLSLSKREADIAIGLSMPQEGRKSSAESLLDYRLYLYASKDYLATKPKIAQKSDLLGHRMIGYINELLFTPELDYLPTILPSLKPQLRSGNLIAQLNATLAGVGVAVLPRFLAQGFPQLAPILPEEIMIQRSFYLLMYDDGKQFPQVPRRRRLCLRAGGEGKGAVSGPAVGRTL